MVRTIPAASLIMVREDCGPPELLMVERAASMAFAPGAMVFPGGRIDAGDRGLAGSDSFEDGAARVAAIRETLEEAGIPAGLVPEPPPTRVLALQRGLVAGSELGRLIGSEGIELDLRALTPFARWVPAHEVSRRFDTRFFLAAAPATGCRPVVGSSECASVRWVSAARMLQEERDGAARLIYPTRMILARLARFRTLAEMIHDAQAYPMEPITPILETQHGESWISIPEGLGYPVTRSRLADSLRG